MGVDAGSSATNSVMLWVQGMNGVLEIIFGLLDPL